MPETDERRRQVQALRAKLDAQQRAWERWFPRLKRAFTTVTRIDARCRKLLRQLAKLEQ